MDAMAPLGVARLEEISKYVKHKLYAESRGATMVAYIVESYGGMGTQARSFNLAIANFAARTSSIFSRDELLQFIFSAVTVGVQE